ECYVLSLHDALPISLGQAVDELRTLGFCEVRTNPKDKRARLVAITAKGTELLAKAPLAGPVRLRQTATDPMRLERLAAALEDARSEEHTSELQSLAY